MSKDEAELELTRERFRRSNEVELKRLAVVETELEAHAATVEATNRQREAITKWHEDAPREHADRMAAAKDHTDRLVGLITEQNALLARIVAVLEAKAP